MTMLRTFVLLLLIASGVLAQDMSIGRCNLSIAGGVSKEAFLQFDREFRHALAVQDPVEIAFLVRFPLRVNEPGRGSNSINGPGALQSRYAEAFAPEVRSVVRNQKLEEIFCNFSGIMYGQGTVWVYPTNDGYLVGSINLKRAVTLSRKTTNVVYMCNAENTRAVVERLEDGTRRYRAWEKPRSFLDGPNAELLDGASTYEVSGVCAYQLWKFQDGESETTLSSLGCSAISNQPPEGARGRLTVAKAGETKSSWCF